MQIAILSFFTGKVERGVEVYAENLHRFLKSKSQIKIYDSSSIGIDIKPYVSSSSLRRKLYLDSTSLQIKRATQLILKKLASNPPDILYPLNNGWQSLLCKKFSSLHKSKLLLAGHSGPGWDDKINLKLKPHAFITFSKAQKNWALDNSHGVRVEHIPHGVNITNFSPAPTQVKIDLPRPIFVSVSALSPQRRGGETVKNIDHTIQAISFLDKGSLLLIGKGPDAQRIDKLAKTKLGSRYHRLSVSHNLINNYYQIADVFTLVSSTSEAFGLVYLEALASGLPVVTVSDPIKKEIIGSAGIFVSDSSDIAEYSRALIKALNTKWGQKPLLQAKKFAWKKITSQYMKLFESLSK